MPTQDVIVLARNCSPSKPGALSQSPTSKRAGAGRGTTASALAAARASLCLCHASDRPGSIVRTIALRGTQSCRSSEPDECHCQSARLGGDVRPDR